MGDRRSGSRTAASRPSQAEGAPGGQGVWRCGRGAHRDRRADLAYPRASGAGM